MEAALARLARYARPILLWVPVVLAAGAMVTVMGLTLAGWAIYAVGYLGLMVALAAVVAVHRGSFDWFGWVSAGVLFVGLLLGLPVLLIMFGHYAQNPDLHEAVMPFELTPLGMISGVVTWVGFALFGWAAYRVRAFSTATAVVFVVAAALGLLAEFAVLAPVMWGLAIILVAYVLVWIAPAAPLRTRADVPAPASAGVPAPAKADPAKADPASE